MDKRRLCLTEIYDTEKAYVKDLQYIVDEWLKPLRANEMVPRGQLPDVFGNIELILSVNKQLFEKMDKCISSYEEGASGEQVTGFGEIFESSCRLLVCYHQFCSNHSHALNVVTQWRKNAKFEQFAHERESASGMTLTSYLIKPVQRICKYPLLFRELIRLTSENHPDRTPLERAFEMLSEVTLQINEIKRQAENLSKLHDIAHQTSGLPMALAEDGRWFVKEGTLMKINPKGKIQERYFFLFNDLLIWAEKGGVGVKKTYRYRGHFPMTSALVKQPDPPPKDKPSKDMIPSSQFALAFQLVQMQKQKVYTYLAKDEKEKKEWMDVLEKVNSGTFLAAEASSKDADPSKGQMRERRLTSANSTFSTSASSLPIPAASPSLTNSPASVPLSLADVSEGEKEKEKEVEADRALIQSLEEKNGELSKRLKNALQMLEEAKKEKEKMEEIIHALVLRVEAVEKRLEKEKGGEKEVEEKGGEKEEKKWERGEEKGEEKEGEKGVEKEKRKRKKSEKK